LLQFCYMQIVIAARHHQITQAGIDIIGSPHSIHLVPASSSFAEYANADAFVDFGFEGAVFSPAQKPLLIAETVQTLAECPNLPEKVARFCGWPTMIERPLWEMAARGSSDWLTPIMEGLGKQFEIVSDVPGLVAPRIISTIINEAFYALAEGVSNEEEIDIAMKLGTNYPAGPFEWAIKIGAFSICQLLQKLAETDRLYAPHPLLVAAASKPNN
jgi:3-hydroxybutyryl-CoA dehydrogenase